VDLIEEVARVHGYEHIPEDRPVPLARSAKGRRERVESEVRAALTGLGFDEACTFSLVANADWDPFPTAESSLPPLKVEHSTRKREVYLRKSITPSLLHARGYNEAHGTADADLFEISGVYRPRSGNPLPEEPTRLAIVSGRDFLALKGLLDALWRRLHLEGALDVRPSDHAMLAPGRQADVTLDGVPFATIGEVDSAAYETFGLRSPCSIAEIDFGQIQERATLVPQNRPLPTFPAVERDLSLIVEQSLPWAELADAARKAGGASLESLAFLDTFSGGNVPEGRHSLHFGLTFRNPDRTLTGEEVERAIRAVVEACAARFGATLRT
jgi:phenylalanyl-tRNA synthetase beta chain